MIRSIRSDRPTFKTVQLKQGLNIILATKIEDEDSETTLHRTRNGAGKSSVIDIVRFVLGGSPKKGEDVLASAELSEDTFSLDLDLYGTPLLAIRSLTQKGQIEVQADQYVGFPEPPREEEGRVWFSSKVWSRVVAHALFGLPQNLSDEAKNNLSASSLLAYFTRRARDGAFGDWVRTHRSQSLNKQAVPIFYLLGLDTSAPLEYVKYSEARNAAVELRKAAQSGVLADIVGNRSRLRNDLVKARNRLRRVKERVGSQNILEFYGAYQNEAAEIDADIRNNNNENFLDAALIERCRKSMQEESPPDFGAIQLLYDEAGVHLGDNIRRRVEDIEAFHASVISNRKTHLEAETSSARDRISVRDEAIRLASTRLAQIRELLSGSIALGDYRKLEKEIAALESEESSLEQA